MVTVSEVSQIFLLKDCFSKKSKKILFFKNADYHNDPLCSANKQGEVHRFVTLKVMSDSL